MLLIALLAAVLVLPFPVYGRHWGPLFDAAHAPTFCTVFLIARWFAAALRKRRAENSASAFPSRMSFAIAALIWIVGLVGELAQSFVGREPSIGDATANTCGLIGGVLFSQVFAARSRGGRVVFAFAGLMFVTTPVVYPLRVVRECFLQEAEFPLLASFERPLELTAWNPHSATLAESRDWATDGTQCLQITATEGTRNPGATFVWPIGDWSQFEFLEFTVRNPNAAAVTLGLNISDRQHAETGFDPTDRFRLSQLLPPGETRSIKISVTELRDAPETREMNLATMAMLDVYFTGAESGETLLVDTLLLR